MHIYIKPCNINPLYLNWTVNATQIGNIYNLKYTGMRISQQETAESSQRKQAEIANIN